VPSFPNGFPGAATRKLQEKAYHLGGIGTRVRALTAYRNYEGFVAAGREKG
jgi:hypothetical protein